MQNPFLRPPHLALGALLLGTLPVAAQDPCFTPDMFAGPCCDEIDPNLPQLAPFTVQGTGICWDGCALAGEECTLVAVDAPVATDVCGQYDVTVSIQSCSGAQLLKGVGRMDYARTWTEQGTAPGPDGPIEADYQVWRYLLKIDFESTEEGGPQPSCTVPADLVVNDTVFYYGYVDYAKVCQTGQFEHALMLFHGCDWLINNQLLSSNQGGANPIRSHAIVAPDTQLIPFQPLDFFVAAAPTDFDAVRTIGDLANPGGPAGCNAEEDLLPNGTYNPLAYGCLCPPSAGPTQVAVIDMVGQSDCGSAFQSLNLFGVTPWFETVSMSIGEWTTGNDYPGPERVRADEGLFLYRDGCEAAAGAANGGQAFEIFYGAETVGGFAAYLREPFGVQVFAQHFVDLVSNWRRPAGSPLVLPAIGSVMESFHLISTNPD